MKASSEFLVTVAQPTPGECRHKRKCPSFPPSRRRVCGSCCCFFSDISGHHVLFIAAADAPATSANTIMRAVEPNLHIINAHLLRTLCCAPNK